MSKPRTKMRTNPTESLEGNQVRLAYTSQEAAQMLAVTPKTIYRLVDRGLLKSSKALRHLRITRQSLEQFMVETSVEGGRL